MIMKTKKYDMFTLRDDNREKIDQAHVKRLCESINSRNLLEFRPIIVNEKMEIIDGQHRLLAAKQLGVEIYYQVEKKLDALDIIKMNVSKNWTMLDYLNFYCVHEYAEYVKLKDFMDKHNLTLRVALYIAIGERILGYDIFKKGEFVFEDKSMDEEMYICWDTIKFIKKMNGGSYYTHTGRFWKALLKLIRHPEFKLERWMSNLERLVSHFSPKASTLDYIKTISKIYNWHTVPKIELSTEGL